MKVVILAAGRGSRLGNNQELPKPLTKLANDQSILDYQLEQLSKFSTVSNISIVVGYHKEDIMKAFPSYSFVINDNWANENTSKSLLKGIENIDDDLLWINGDVVFHPQALSVLLSLKESAMLVNKATVGIEEVKYRTDEHGNLLEVSKVAISPQGEAVGINFLERKYLASFKSKLQECLPNDYFEKGIEGLITEGCKIKAAVIDSSWCKEIDFYEDLLEANKLLLSWDGSGKKWTIVDDSGR